MLNFTSTKWVGGLADIEVFRIDVCVIKCQHEWFNIDLC